MQPHTWFITGISSGLGQALAAAALAQGDIVAGTFRHAGQAEAFRHTTQGRSIAYVLDVTDPAGVATAVQAFMEEVGRLDRLVNNAGFGFAGAVEEASEAELRAVMETNFYSVWRITQAFLPMLRRQGQGHIFQISSHGGFKAFPGFGIYNASKFAVEGLSEALAAELAPLGIRVTIVEPGPFRTAFAGVGFRQAANHIPAYAETAGAFRTRMSQVHGRQEGDPALAARAILAAADSAQPPLRLPLGRVALGSLRAKLSSVQADLEAWEAVAAAAVFEPGQ
ncbi:MAG: oxidoreductase [Bacteroidia bacterium]|nr:oxidoreductase [Bacteroidia bacterium]